MRSELATTRISKKVKKKILFDLLKNYPKKKKKRNEKSISIKLYYYYFLFEVKCDQFIAVHVKN